MRHMIKPMKNLDQGTVRGFGEEWTWYDQSRLSQAERARQFDSYFHIFPWHLLPPSAEGFDAGCGSGRWAAVVAPKVGTLHCVDASPGALAVARINLSRLPNCRFHYASLQDMPLQDSSMDFGYALGVLHHMPDTRAGLQACVSKLKIGAPLLLYIYYAFDNRPAWFRLIWRLSDLLRRAISRLPSLARLYTTQVIATTVYWPLGRSARLLEALGANVENLPLSGYRRASFYSMRTDALDRFGTRLEKRFTAIQIEDMMREAGLEDVCFSNRPPFWCAVGIRRR